MTNRVNEEKAGVERAEKGKDLVAGLRWPFKVTDDTKPSLDSRSINFLSPHETIQTKSSGSTREKMGERISLGKYLNSIFYPKLYGRSDVSEILGRYLPYGYEITV
jgi:hypothetical protein